MGRFEWGSEPNIFVENNPTDNEVIHVAVPYHKIWVRSVAINCTASGYVGIEDEDSTLLYPQMQTTSMSEINLPARENKGVQLSVSGFPASGVTAAIYVEYYIEPADHI